MRNSAVFLIAKNPILNPEKVKKVENLNVNYSVYLNSLLYQNWIEIFYSLEYRFDYHFILNEGDKDFIPKKLIPEEGSLLLTEKGVKEFHQIIANRIRQNNYKKIIFIYYNSIGINKEVMLKISDLLSMDDKLIVIGKAQNEQLAFAGTNSVDEKILSLISSPENNYTVLLSRLSKEDIFIQTIESFLSIHNFNDINKLYIELSKKESLSYCSEDMHERFNDLFIEYKELLNE